MLPRVVTFVSMCFWFSSWSPAADAIKLVDVRTAATIESMGIEIDIEGDADHDAQCEVQFRPKGTEAWNNAWPLLRVDFRGFFAGMRANRHYNLLAGSIMHLEPGQEYEVQLQVKDPDGGSESRALAVKTRPQPEVSANRRVLHVVPGLAKRGPRRDGSEEKPFMGLEEAQAAARPGDLLLLRAGRYGRFRFDRSGEPGNYIVWQASDEGEVEFTSIDVAASHVWIEGLVLERTGGRTGIQGVGNSMGVVVRRNLINGYPYGIVLSNGSSSWNINNNSIRGDLGGIVEQNTRTVGGTGIDLAKSKGHIVSHNSIARTSDGISYPGGDCDIMGNDLRDLMGDGIKGDYGYANIRVFRNRLAGIRGFAFTFQPMFCGPWYFIRNQICGAGQIFKFRIQDRFVLCNNTFATWSPFGNHMHYLLTSVSRNNLYISLGAMNPDDSLWSALDCRQPNYCAPNNYAASWATNVDFDGFDWGDLKTPFTWNNGSQRFSSFKELTAAAGIEANARRVRKEEIFANAEFSNVPGPMVPQVLELRAGCSAIDVGQVMPNLIDKFQGKAPDLGAHEFGLEAPPYGPQEPNRAAE